MPRAPPNITPDAVRRLRYAADAQPSAALAADTYYAGRALISRHAAERRTRCTPLR